MKTLIVNVNTMNSEYTTKSQDWNESHDEKKNNDELVFSDLELMKYKIKSVDARKILRLLEDAIGKVEMISLLLQFEKDLSNPVLSVDMRKAVQMFCQLKSKISLDQSYSHDDKPIHSNCDTFIKNSWMLKWVIPESLKSNTSNNVSVLSILLKQLEFITIEQFSKTPLEIKQELKLLKELKRELLQLSKQVKSLAEQLEETKQQKIKTEQKFAGIIEEIRLDVSRIEWLATDKMDTNVKAAEKITDKTEKEGREAVAKFEQQVMKLSNQLDEAITSNIKSEKELRLDKRLIQEEIAAVVAQYDLEMGDRQSRYDFIHKEYEEELEKAEKLNSRVDELKESYDMIMEEMRRKAEEMERLQAEFEEQSEAAIIIQAIWRGYRMRKILKGGDKKEKGKKGGKKGKGKKK